METIIRGIRIEAASREAALAAYFAPQLLESGEWLWMDTATQWAVIREVRNGLLATSDWTQVGDSPLSAGLREQWQIYRQALRDLPGAFSDPAGVIWPVDPV